MRPFSDELREVAAPIWDEMLGTPFIQALISGGLDREQFRTWVVQNYLYLVELAKLLDRTAAKMHEPELVAWFSKAAVIALESDSKLHKDYAAHFRCEHELGDYSKVLPATANYTNHLHRYVAVGTPAVIVSALLPCLWGFVELGKRINATAKADGFYREWIDAYSSAEYATLAGEVLSFVDRLLPLEPKSSRELCVRAFRESCHHELEFWRMPTQGSKWNFEVGGKTAR
ncbi:TenA family protein [Fimbriiglobus ruber]|uniref:Thiaminase II n=1 Tax=Fimbriiglobus ruber TaxID=1908690 RepID=A0A225DFP4_9BACT|nr:hypothetical protein [Fimbriiglobus ruber]OWK34907.1 Thiaminase II [Fimbriiglobus ruber]